MRQLEVGLSFITVGKERVDIVDAVDKGGNVFFPYIGLVGDERRRCFYYSDGSKFQADPNDQDHIEKDAEGPVYWSVPGGEPLPFAPESNVGDTVWIHAGTRSLTKAEVVVIFRRHGNPYYVVEYDAQGEAVMVVVAADEVSDDPEQPTFCMRWMDAEKVDSRMQSLSEELKIGVRKKEEAV